MSKTITALITLCAIALFTLGAVVFSRPTDPAITAARAAQEQAKASQAEAEAAAAWAAAREKQTHAIAVQQAQAATAWAIQAATIGSAVLALSFAAGLLSIGLWALWAGARARAALVTFYPKAGAAPVLVFQANGQITALDTGRALGSVTTIGPAGQIGQPLAGDDAAHGALSAQALAANVIANATTGQSAGAAAAAVTRAVGDAMTSLPALAGASSKAPAIVFSDERPADRVRVIRRNPQPAPAPDDPDDGAVDRAHLVEFLTHGAAAGFRRANFAGFTFSDGARCSQSEWARLVTTARAAGVLAGDKTAALNRTLDEALAVFNS